MARRDERRLVVVVVVVVDAVEGTALVGTAVDGTAVDGGRATIEGARALHPRDLDDAVVVVACGRRP